mmetsp:Transcript_13882/g.28439  ORF Transcript_13882/g.28439 Transcript_13882/m.28439 type:complete len:112 (-) Transcript_13882:32-367(-)
MRWKQLAQGTRIHAIRAIRSSPFTQGAKSFAGAGVGGASHICAGSAPAPSRFAPIRRNATWSKLSPISGVGVPSIERSSWVCPVEGRASTDAHTLQGLAPFVVLRRKKMKK